MHSRRKFMMNGSMALTALLASKPIETLANVATPFTGGNYNKRHVVFLHTNKLAETITAEHLRAVKSQGSNLLLLDGGSSVIRDLSYDAVMPLSDFRDYKIIHKGAIKTGIVYAGEGEADTISRINSLAAFLKNERDCNLVVCLSGLGYKHKDKLCDRKLAAGSENVDLIIGGHSENFCRRPVIALNSKKQEVIINHLTEDKKIPGKIEIGFDKSGRKNMIVF